MRSFLKSSIFMPEKAFYHPFLWGFTVCVSESKPWSAHLAWIRIASTSKSSRVLGRASSLSRFLSSNRQSNSSTLGCIITFDKYLSSSVLSSLRPGITDLALFFVFWSVDFARSLFSLLFFSSSSSYSLTHGIITSNIVPAYFSNSRGIKLVSLHIDFWCRDLLLIIF